ncbi:MAG: OadG family protein [Candidatus Thermoplasmatota archaeon]|nr:OadG family protein [Candidatus Thermoplasmatota archaeon]
MTVLEVIVIGIGVVFLTLTILTFATYFFGWVINNYFVEEEKDEKDKVAAIVAAVQTRGGK